MIGKTVAHYTITEKIGAGGMGEVFRAADSKLGRDVALKMLPATLARDAERMARFQREAQVLASLNHPNIGAIYGLEEHDDAHFLVLELIEGPTLFDRLGAGRLPRNEALEIARQIAEAVELAHESGVVHRDLKPANVKVTDDGRVKVLDFGLAKAMEDPTQVAASGSADPSASPTLTRAQQSPISNLTAAHVILGTAAYMSPEQARGKPIDRRADIWAFGVMLWEMLTGNRLFDGETVSDTLAAVLRKQPDWEALRADTPPRIRWLVRRCLERDPKKRLRDIGDARIVIDEVLAGDLGEESSAHAAPATRTLPRLLIAAGVLAAVAAAFVTGGLLTQPEERELPLRKFVFPVEDLTVSGSFGTTLAMAPDGARVAYTSGGLLWVRDLDRLEARSLAGTEGAIAPFWSPDGEWLAYASGKKLWKIRVTGGEPSPICDLRNRCRYWCGGVWRSDGQIVFNGSWSPLMTVSSQGGDPEVFLPTDRETTDPESVRYVTGLPADRGVVFVVRSTGDEWDRIDAFADGVRHELVRHEGQSIKSPSYSPSGHLVYRREPDNAGIWAVPFSLDELKVTGKPFLVIPNGARPHVAADGTLVHAVGGGSVTSELLVVTREGSVVERLPHRKQYWTRLALAPDGRRVAVQILAEDSELWITDLQRSTNTPLTSDPDVWEMAPSWSPDGERVYYTAIVKYPEMELRMRAADGTGEEAVLGPGSEAVVSPDGRFLVYSHDRAIRYMPLGDDGLPAGEGIPIVAAEGADAVWHLPQLSPSGEYLAYVSFTSNTEQAQIYLTRFPSGEGKWQVTTDGGLWPRWSASGDELFFVSWDPGDPAKHGRELYGVSVRTDPSLRLGKPSLLFSREADTGIQTLRMPDEFAVFPDGRFLIFRPTVSRDEGGIQGLVVTQNWFAEFRGTE